MRHIHLLANKMNKVCLKCLLRALSDLRSIILSDFDLSLQTNVAHLVYVTSCRRHKHEKRFLEKLNSSLDVLKRRA